MGGRETGERATGRRDLKKQVEGEKREKKTERDERMRSGGGREKKSSLDVYFIDGHSCVLNLTEFSLFACLPNGTLSIPDYHYLMTFSGAIDHCGHLYFIIPVLHWL
ncbi:hypothetical protein BJX61DRAFT_204136 [Aspergillus egyptiacus]|nr:hypothetical protein BJX61DRAFT_204136 [Aspergillus egyptiacus]